MHFESLAAALAKVQAVLPCPPTTSDALPATIDPTRPTIGATTTNAAEDDTSPAESRSSTDPIMGDVIEGDEFARGSAEEAKAKEHLQ